MKTQVMEYQVFNVTYVIIPIMLVYKNNLLALEVLVGTPLRDITTKIFRNDAKHATVTNDGQISRYDATTNRFHTCVKGVSCFVDCEKWFAFLHFWCHGGSLFGCCKLT